jgi:hypothetical protein
MKKWMAMCATAGLLAFGIPTFAAQTAQTGQTQTDTQSDTAKDNAKKAGKETKKAAKDTGKAVKEGAKGTAGATKSTGEKLTDALKDAVQVKTTDAPKDATAQCNDGTWTKVRTSSKACTGAHKGVKAVVCPGPLCGS